MAHLKKKKENVIISGLRNYVLRHQKYSGGLINYRMTTHQHQGFALDLEAKDLGRHH